MFNSAALSRFSLVLSLAAIAFGCARAPKKPSSADPAGQDETRAEEKLKGADEANFHTPKVPQAAAGPSASDDSLGDELRANEITGLIGGEHALELDEEPTDAPAYVANAQIAQSNSAAAPKPDPAPPAEPERVPEPEKLSLGLDKEQLRWEADTPQRGENGRKEGEASRNKAEERSKNAFRGVKDGRFKTTLSDKTPSDKTRSGKKGESKWAFDGDDRLDTAVLIPVTDQTVAKLVDNEKNNEGKESGFVAGKGKQDRQGQLDFLTTEPADYMPKTCYVENTYLGGNAAYLEQLRRLDLALDGMGRPHRLAEMATQPFDAPPKAGVALTAALNTRWFEQTGRVYLQVGIQGSHRHGWRRPPLEIVLVVDDSAQRLAPRATEQTIRTLLDRLGKKDTLGVVFAGERPRVVAPIARVRTLRTELLPTLGSLGQPSQGGARGLAAAMARAGTLLEQAADNRTTLPGTQIVLVLTRSKSGERVTQAHRQAHALTTHGVVTSVLELGKSGAWWPVANAGHGNYHRIEPGAVQDAVDAELESVSRVVARLLRLNVRLAPGVKGIRVLGSRVLDQKTVKQVKAREVAADTHLSRSLGIDSDRGDDDDGIQTVIPYFYGGDTHVMVFELWVTHPGAVADVSLKYKDMVSLRNATARTAVTLRNVPRTATGEQLQVAKNLRGFELGDALRQAADLLENGDGHRALAVLTNIRSDRRDEALLSRFTGLLQQSTWQHDPQHRALMVEALRMAGRRKVGGTHPG